MKAHAMTYLTDGSGNMICARELRLGSLIIDHDGQARTVTGIKHSPTYIRMEGHKIAIALAVTLDSGETHFLHPAYKVETGQPRIA